MFEDIIKQKKEKFHYDPKEQVEKYKKESAPFTCISCGKPIKRGQMCPYCNPHGEETKKDGEI